MSEKKRRWNSGRGCCEDKTGRSVGGGGAAVGILSEGEPFSLSLSIRVCM